MVESLGAHNPNTKFEDNFLLAKSLAFQTFDLNQDGTICDIDLLASQLPKEDPDL